MAKRRTAPGAQQTRARRARPIPDDPTHVKDLAFDLQNPRAHTARNVGMIERAIEEVGFAGAGTIDEQGVVLVGNARVEAAIHAGLTKLIVVPASGSEVVMVRRTGLSPEQKRRLKLYDNRSAELAEWERDELRRQQEAGDDLSPFFLDHERDALLDAPSDTPGEKGSGSGGGQTVEQGAAEGVTFAFGSYHGTVSREVYAAFESAYAAERDRRGPEASLDDILRAWLTIT